MNRNKEKDTEDRTDKRDGVDRQGERRGGVYTDEYTGAHKNKNKKTKHKKNQKEERDCLFVCWLLNVPATCECISGTDLHRQFYVLPH